MSDRVQIERKPCGCVEYEFQNAYGPARSAVLCWEHAHAEPLREARRLAEEYRDMMVRVTCNTLHDFPLPWEVRK